MRTIAIFTTTRAEFGLLSSLLNEIQKSTDLKALLFVGGTHLKDDSGNTINEITASGFEITATFDYLQRENSQVAITRSIGIATTMLADIFSKFSFDFVCILGDRYELISIVSAAIIFRKPIIHIHGGEISEGAIDEQVRHMITKASHIHFVSCDEYAQNVRRMGEASWRIHNTGALAVDNITQLKLLSKQELFQILNLNPGKPTILLTYHPVTLELKIPSSEQIQNIFNALTGRGYQLVITGPNADTDSEQVLITIQQNLNNNKDYHFFNSLGVVNYLSLIPYCKFVIGNSSSGIIEVPFFKIPTVNIGDRQKGRIRHKSVIDTDYSAESIVAGIEKATNKTFCDQIQKISYKFGSGNVAEKMVAIIRKINIDSSLMQKTLDF